MLTLKAIKSKRKLCEESSWQSTFSGSFHVDNLNNISHISQHNDNH